MRKKETDVKIHFYFGQIVFATWTNTFLDLDKCSWKELGDDDKRNWRPRRKWEKKDKKCSDLDIGLFVLCWCGGLAVGKRPNKKGETYYVQERVIPKHISAKITEGQTVIIGAKIFCQRQTTVKEIGRCSSHNMILGASQWEGIYRGGEGAKSNTLHWHHNSKCWKWKL